MSKITDCQCPACNVNNPAPLNRMFDRYPNGLRRNTFYMLSKANEPHKESYQKPLAPTRIHNLIVNNPDVTIQQLDSNHPITVDDILKAPQIDHTERLLILRTMNRANTKVELCVFKKHYDGSEITFVDENNVITVLGSADIVHKDGVSYVQQYGMKLTELQSREFFHYVSEQLACLRVGHLIDDARNSRMAVPSHIGKTGYNTLTSEYHVLHDESRRMYPSGETANLLKRIAKNGQPNPFYEPKLNKVGTVYRLTDAELKNINQHEGLTFSDEEPFEFLFELKQLPLIKEGFGVGSLFFVDVTEHVHSDEDKRYFILLRRVWKFNTGTRTRSESPVADSVRIGGMLSVDAETETWEYSGLQLIQHADGTKTVLNDVVSRMMSMIKNPRFFELESDGSLTKPKSPKDQIGTPTGRSWLWNGLLFVEMIREDKTRHCNVYDSKNVDNELDTTEWAESFLYWGGVKVSPFGSFEMDYKTGDLFHLTLPEVYNPLFQKHIEEFLTRITK